MFRNIAMNLKDGGRFVSVTVPPSSNPIDSLNAEANARPPPAGAGYLTYHYIRDVEDGIYFRLHADTPVGELNFECYHLKKELYEEAAREAGLKGKLEWGVTKVSERYLKGEGPGQAWRNSGPIRKCRFVPGVWNGLERNVPIVPKRANPCRFSISCKDFY
jgi:hypothetical protein